jgi:hypothetical protein
VGASRSTSLPGSIPPMGEIFQRKIGRSIMDYLAQFA